MNDERRPSPTMIGDAEFIRKFLIGLGIIVAIMRRRPEATADDVSLMKG